MNVASSDAVDETRTRAHLEARVKKLTHIKEGVQAELGLAMFRLYQQGALVPEIAHLACEKEPVVAKGIELALIDPDVDGYPEGPTWTEVWPHHGWSANR